MDNYDEPKDILNEFFYKDISGIITNYIYVNCNLCKNDTLQDKTVDGVNKTFYCLSCIKDSIVKKCHTCNLFYSFSKYNYPSCSVCLGGCHIYCNKCSHSWSDNEDDIYDNTHLLYFWTVFDRVYHTQHNLTYDDN